MGDIPTDYGARMGRQPRNEIAVNPSQQLDCRDMAASQPGHRVPTAIPY